MKLCINSEYAPEYLKEAAGQYAEVWQINEAMFVHGNGHRKTTQQRHYEKLKEYADKLEEYVEKIKICGEDCNSYSKTDHSATFMRIKTDYMGNDQLLPAYNVPVGVADEYIAVVDVNQYRSDMDCFIPLMNKYGRQEVIENLESIHGALLRMNRSIQAEGTFGIMKNNR